jgi:hypothetical protein
MKRLTINMLLAVAGVVLATGTVSAQAMKAEIPFSFRVGKQVMQPGAYHVSFLPGTNGVRVVKVTNSDVRRTVLMAPIYTETSKSWTAAGMPKLRFACSEGPCALVSLWMGDGDTLAFSSERMKNGEPRIAEITLRPERAAD